MDAYSVSHGLLNLLGQQGRMEEHDELEGKIMAAKKKLVRPKQSPAKEARCAAMDAFCDALNADNLFEGAGEDGLVLAAGRKLVTKVREEWQEDPTAEPASDDSDAQQERDADEVAPLRLHRGTYKHISFFEMTFVATVLWEKLNRLPEAIDLIRECIQKGEEQADHTSYLRDEMLWAMQLRLVEMLSAKCTEHLERGELEEARKLAEALMQAADAPGRSYSTRVVDQVNVRIKLVAILRQEAHANHHAANAGLSEADDGLVHTELHIMAHRAIEQLGQAERLARAAGELRSGLVTDAESDWIRAVFTRRRKLPTAEECCECANQLRRQARIWAGEDISEEEGEEDDWGEEDWGEEDEGEEDGDEEDWGEDDDERKEGRAEEQIEEHHVEQEGMEEEGGMLAEDEESAASERQVKRVRRSDKDRA